MNITDKKRFVTSVMKCASLYMREVSDLQLAGLWEALEDQSIEDIERAFLSHSRTAPKFPTAFELISLIPISKQKNLKLIGNNQPPMSSRKVVR